MQFFLKNFYYYITQLFLYFWVNQVYMLLRQRNIFVSSPRWVFISSPVGFFISPVENLLQGLTPEKVWKFDIFPSGLSSPHWATETRCYIELL